MPVTTLDPVSALIVVDLQQGIVALPGIPDITQVITHARTLAATFRSLHLPVVLVNVEGGAPGRTEQPRRNFDPPAGWMDLIPELDRQATDLLVTKRTWGAFTRTDLESCLRARGVTQVVVLGVATSTGVESTARQAYELGFHVTLAIDAVADLRPEAHEYSLRNVFPRLGETGTTDDILQLLAHRSPSV